MAQLTGRLDTGWLETGGFSDPPRIDEGGVGKIGIAGPCGWREAASCIMVSGNPLEEGLVVWDPVAPAETQLATEVKVKICSEETVVVLEALACWGKLVSTEGPREEEATDGRFQGD